MIALTLRSGLVAPMYQKRGDGAADFSWGHMGETLTDTIPTREHELWTNLIGGEQKLVSSNVAVNLLLFNCQLRYKKDPSPSNLNHLVTLLHDFFCKYQNCLRDELTQLR